MEDVSVSHQEEIICQVHGMDMRKLLDLIIENSFFLTDSYYARIGQAIRVRHAELAGHTCPHCSLLSSSVESPF